MSAAARLQRALAKADRRAFVAAAVAAGMDRGDVGMAFVGKRITATAYMRLCALCAIDAATGSPIDAAPYPQRINWPHVAVTLRAWRALQGLTLAEAGKSTTIQRSTLHDAERGTPVSIESFLAICALVERRPESFLICGGNVSRETSTRKNAGECQPGVAA